MKYVSVLRYRQAERNALKSVAPISKNLPLLEVVANRQIDQVLSDLPVLKSTVMIDLPTYLPVTTRTEQSIGAFLQEIQVNPESRLAYYQRLQDSRVIPVVTYNPQLSTYSGNIQLEAWRLRDLFPRLAFRIFVQHALIAINEIKQVIKGGDIVVMDIDEAPHTQPYLKSTVYPQVVALKTQVNCDLVLVRSAIPASTKNTGLTNNAVVAQADNSLLSDFQNYNFGAFGDFAGIKKTDLSEGGTISPGVIFYSWKGNNYYGFNSSVKSVEQFARTIAPNIVQSQPWISLSATHRNTCPGCLRIAGVATGSTPSGNQATWKQISCAHYLYTMEESL